MPVEAMDAINKRNSLIRKQLDKAGTAVKNIKEQHPLINDIKTLCDLSDKIGRSRQSNNYAMNGVAIERFVDLQEKVVEAIKTLTTPDPVAWAVTVGSDLKNNIGFFTDRADADAEYEGCTAGGFESLYMIQALFTGPKSGELVSSDIDAFRAWKGYLLPELNSDGRFDQDHLHREFVAYKAGRAAQSAHPKQSPPELQGRPTISLRWLKHGEQSYGVELLVTGLDSERQAQAALEHLQNEVCGAEIRVN